MSISRLEGHNCSLCMTPDKETTTHRSHAEAYNNLFAEYTKLQQASWTATVHRKLNGKPFQFFHPVIEKITALLQALFTKQSQAIREKAKPLKEIETGFQNDRKEYMDKIFNFLKGKCSDPLYDNRWSTINEFSQTWWKKNLFTLEFNYTDSDSDSSKSETLSESRASCFEEKQKPALEQKTITNQDLTQFDSGLADLFAKILPKGKGLTSSLQNEKKNASKSKKITEKFKEGVSSFLHTSSDSTKNSLIDKEDSVTERQQSLHTLLELKKINFGLYVKTTAAWANFHDISLNELAIPTADHVKISEEIERLSQTSQEKK